MSIESNKELLRRFVADVLDGQNLDAADEYLSENFVHHDQAPGELTRHQTGLKGQKAFFEDVVFTAFSGFETQFEDMVAEGDLVAGRWRQASRNTGPWLGQRPTGRTTEIAGVSIVRIRDERIVEEWEARDALGLFQQLGIPVPKLRLPAAEELPPRPRRPVLGSPMLTNGPLVGLRGGGDRRDRRAVVGEYFAGAWNGGDVRVLTGLLAPEYTVHDPTGLLRGAGGPGLGRLIRGLHKGMPDLGVTVDLQLTEGDRVVSRWTARGTHTDDLFGLPPTERRATFTGISTVRTDGGQIQEEWQLWEQLSLLQQIGALQP